jgi:hypothetical protein
MKSILCLELFQKSEFVRLQKPDNHRLKCLFIQRKPKSTFKSNCNLEIYLGFGVHPASYPIGTEYKAAVA